MERNILYTCRFYCGYLNSARGKIKSDSFISYLNTALALLMRDYYKLNCEKLNYLRVFIACAHSIQKHNCTLNVKRNVNEYRIIIEIENANEKFDSGAK